MGDKPNILLVHDGELDDARAILEDLHADFVERLGRPTNEDQETLWKAVIGTPRHVLELQVGASGVKPIRVVLISGDSRTLLAMLRRSGVDLMVRRPVDPAALRLLLLHALYSGPEKRRHPRITIGAPIRFRTGFRRRQGTLADLSSRGCRLLASFSPKKDQILKIQLPTSLGCSRSVTIDGRVVRSGSTDGAGTGQNAVAVCFDALNPKQSAAIREVLEAHVRGPAQLEAQSKARPSAAAPEAVEEVSEAVAVVPEVNERRDAERVDLDKQRVTALGVEATKVLIGRDISLGGMRVEPNNKIELGYEFKLAVHLRARQQPLVVSARATRDDGDEGMLLEFFDLDDAAQKYLEKMVNFLPILAARGGETGSGVIVSEILDEAVSSPGSDGHAELGAPDGAASDEAVEADSAVSADSDDDSADGGGDTAA